MRVKIVANIVLPETGDGWQSGGRGVPTFWVDAWSTVESGILAGAGVLAIVAPVGTTLHVSGESDDGTYASTSYTVDEHVRLIPYVAPSPPPMARRG